MSASHGDPVLKKWLGYWQSSRRDGQPLRTEERRWFRSIVQRIAAVLALSLEIDRLYSAASEDAFTASELEIERQGLGTELRRTGRAVCPPIELPVEVFARRAATNSSEI